MRGKYIPALLCLLLLTISTIPVLGQESGQPLVVFVLNPNIDSASPFDAGPNGSSALTGIFQRAGARTQVINLVEAIPSDADVVVLIGPRKRLSIVSLTRLWVHLAQGKHLLLAIDPPNYGGIDTEINNSGLVALMNNAYGILPYDAFMAENWFSKDSILLLSGAMMRTFPDVVPHPVIAPLLRYDVPILVWGARPMRVEPIGVNSHAVPLLQTSTAYGETTKEVFAFTQESPPLEMNLETDVIGRVDVAALAENPRTGSRVAVLGDSELVRNGYGLATQLDSPSPRNLGNYVFAERLVSWLLGLPEADWPGLPSGYTTLALDGNADDWDPESPVVTDGLDSSPQDYNLRAVRAFHNDAYVYILAQTVGSPNPSIGFTMSVESLDADKKPVILSISADAMQVTMSNGVDEPVAILDGKVVVGSSVEIRLPLRIFGDGNQIDNFCVTQNVDGISQEVDCLAGSGSVEIPTGEGIDLSDVRSQEGPLVTVTSVRNVNLRQLPESNSATVASLTGGRILHAIGRTEDSAWIEVDTGSFTGWIFTSLVVTNFDVNSLPITEATPVQ